MGPIKNGYQLESFCPNVQFLAFFPCAYYIYFMRLYVCKGRCMEMRFLAYRSSLRSCRSTRDCSSNAGAAIPNLLALFVDERKQI